MTIRLPKSDKMLFGVLLIISGKLTPGIKPKGHLFAHGQGQRGNGSAGNVETWMNDENKNLIDGISGSENHVLIAPELYFGENWSDKYFDFCYDYLLKMYNIDPKVFLHGVSLGGQAILSWGAAHNDLVAGILGCCAVTINVDFSKIKCPVLLYAAKDDYLYGESVTTYTKILAANPTAPAKLVAYPFGGHSIWNQVYGEPAVKAFLGLSGTVPPVTTQPPNPPTNTGLKADASATLTSVVGTTAVLDGSKSTGYKWATWEFISGPDVKDAYNIFPNFQKGGITRSVERLHPGKYKVRLSVFDGKGGVSQDDAEFTVDTGTVLPPPPGKEIVGEGIVDGKKVDLYKDHTW